MFSPPPPSYSVPPPFIYDYNTTPPMSPSPAPSQSYYSPRYSIHSPTPSPRLSPKTRHARRSSQEPSGFGYASPRMGWQTPQPYSSPGYYTPGPEYSMPPRTPRTPDYVSSSEKLRGQPRRYFVRSVGVSVGGERCACCPEFSDDDDEDFVFRDRPPPHFRFSRANHGFHQQIPVYEPGPASYRGSRTRRSSYSTRPGSAASTRPTSSASKSSAKPPPAKPAPKATEADAIRAGIPAGYSYKNWDPTEEPIMLLGSVFDANSLGKWIYDWTVFHHGPATPMSDVAGDLWLLLIQLAGKVKRAEECMTRIRKAENKEMVEDFLESGERLWERFGKLLKACESYMWRAAKKEHGVDTKKVSMGKNSGCEFVDSMFGRDRELEKTEKLMTGMRLWSMRFDANCEEILRQPTA
ncbi:MAG: hypothetical protein M1819_004429 [Sarea resinae]|nr:MAG: hypothetical protein M1819_004429 [Sarea resinae]